MLLANPRRCPGLMIGRAFSAPGSNRCWRTQGGALGYDRSRLRSLQDRIDVGEQGVALGEHLLLQFTVDRGDRGLSATKIIVLELLGKLQIRHCLIDCLTVLLRLLDRRNKGL